MADPLMISEPSPDGPLFALVDNSGHQAQQGRASGQRPKAASTLSNCVESVETQSKVVLSGLEPGELWLVPKRAGGAFDPWGVQARHFRQALGMVEAVADDPGSVWVMVTLTVNPSLWRGPAAAFNWASRRYRQTLRAVFGLRLWYVAAFEAHKNGWPHFHVLLRLPSGTPRRGLIRRLHGAVKAAWSMVRFDPATGERLPGRMSAGHVWIDLARSAKGCAAYLAKYVVKRWEAVPEWMGESTRNYRILRMSSAARESMNLPPSPPRSVSVASRKRRVPKRTLYERMARSCSSMDVYRADETGLRYVRNALIPASREGLHTLCSFGAKVTNPGDPRRVRLSALGAAARRLLAHLQTIGDDLHRRFVQQGVESLRRAWHEQHPLQPSLTGGVNFPATDRASPKHKGSGP